MHDEQRRGNTNPANRHDDSNGADAFFGDRITERCAHSRITDQHPTTD